MDERAPPRLERSEHFGFGPIERTGTSVRFSFACSRFGAFTETLNLETERAVPSELLTLLQVALGVSSYKAGAARAVAFPPLTEAGRRMAEALYTEGLAEFFVRSRLAYPPGTAFSGAIIPAATASGKPGSGPPLVAFGGGKDSYVAGAAARAAYGEDPVYTSVIMSEAVGKVLTATAPYPPKLIRRALDPKLLALRDGFSGHVPITAMNILVLTVFGWLQGARAILFANERSADEPTLNANGVEANHQYSKSSAFEELVRDAVSEAAPSAPPTYSVLRPFSELWIAQRFAAIAEAHGRFTSCNRNFRLAGDATQRWCGTCAKCAFTSLITAPFVSRQQAEVMFGEPMLEAPELVPFFHELCGLSEHKPWDCVGTIDECQAAVGLLTRHKDWRDTEIVRKLHSSLLRTKTAEDLQQQADEAEKPRARGALPAELYNAALDLPCA
ncbi:MAG: hypothetical protein AAGH41_10160 [Pseudomonadota bacterium]